MRGRHAGGSVLLGLGLVLAALSCDDQRDTTRVDPLSAGDDPSARTSCVPGQTRACAGACPRGASGYQVCSDEGTSYGGCVCSPGSLITSDRFDIDRDAVGNHRLLPVESFDDLPLNTPGQPLQGAAKVGASCASDDDCVRGLICFDVSDGLSIGGPAGGYCTRPCASVTECEQVDVSSACGTLAGQALCIRLCEAGERDESEVKCLGRDDVTCTSLSALGDQPPSAQPDLGICTPRCQSDEACAGLRCDLASGFCTIFPALERLPIGATCTAGAQCQGGICFASSPQTERVCTAFCTLGVEGCGFDGNEPSVEAGCVLPQVPGESAGDRGLCLELCDTARDCQQANATCLAQPQDGRAGVCVKQVGAGGPPPAPPDPDDAENIGAPCQGDVECGGNLLCLTSSSDPFRFPGGPARGMCSAPCNGSTDCPGDGVCVSSSGDSGVCLRGCVLGGLDSCGGRADLACTAIGERGACVPNCTSDEGCGDRVCQGGVCVDAVEPECSTSADCPSGEICSPSGSCAPEPAPGCSSDTECESGEVCDGASGGCVLAPSEPCTSDAECPGQVCNPSSGACIAAPAIPIGGSCTAAAQCAGAVCPTLGGSRFCTGVCALGTPIGCEPYGSNAFCLLPLPNDPGIGLCLGLCNTPADCAQPDYICTPLEGEIDGRTGACLPPPPAPPPSPASDPSPASLPAATAP